MGVMTAVETAGRFTRADFEALPYDERRRWELLDGAFVVSPAPTPVHQRTVMRLWQLLNAAVPGDLEVFASPLDVFLATGDVLEPDVLVIDKRIVGQKGIEGAPLLAVEVLSPSSRRRDVGDKLTAYRDAGVPSYWVVDPINPRLRAWQLEEGAYVEIADVTGDEEWTSEAPYAVTVRPADLSRH
jgi:Uma2 family endonuclease